MRIFRKPNPWFVGLLCLIGIGFLMHLFTIGFYIESWQDEVQILEIARGGIGRKATAWGLYLTGNRLLDSMAWAPYYLGAAVQESCWNGFGLVGPRIASLIGLCSCAVLFWDYVRIRGCRDGDAFALSLLLFSFPLLVQSARGARVDVWCFACLLVVLRLLWRLDTVSRKVRLARLMGAGAVMTVGVFTWVSSLMFVPICFWACAEDVDLGSNNGRRELASRVLIAGGGALVTACVILIPLFPRLSDFRELMHGLAKDNSRPVSSRTIGVAAREFLRYFVGVPFVFLVGSVLLFIRRKARILQFGYLAFVATCVLVTARIYEFRMLYFAPYAFVGLALYLASLRSARARRFWSIGIQMMAMLSLIFTVVFRNGVDYCSKWTRSLEGMIQRFEVEIGRDAEVYVDDFEVYPTGRHLGWRMYRSHLGDIRQIMRLCPNVEYVILNPRKRDVYVEKAAYIESIGYKHYRDVTFDPPAKGSVMYNVLKRCGRRLCSGPYVIFKKKSS